MEIFLFTICFFLIVGGGVFLIISLHNLIPKIQEEIQRAKELDILLYKELREVQFKARQLGQIANKLDKQKYSLFAELLQGIIITLMPFRKLKSVMIIYSFLKKLYTK